MSDKFFRTCRDYEMAYRSGCKGTQVEAAVKELKSRRRVMLIAKVTEYDDVHEYALAYNVHVNKFCLCYGILYTIGFFLYM